MLRKAALVTGCMLGLVVGAAGVGVLMSALDDAPEQALTQPPRAGPGGCTLLVLDRNDGRTEAGPCTEAAPLLAAAF